MVCQKLSATDNNKQTNDIYDIKDIINEKSMLTAILVKHRPSDVHAFNNIP